MRQAGRFQPLVAINLVIADDVAHAVRKNFSTASGQRIHSCIFELLQSLADRKLCPLGQIRDFHHRKSLEMHLRKSLFQAGDQIKKILKRQIGMQPADDVKLGDRFAVARCGGFEYFFECHGVGTRSIRFSTESAEAAGGHAHVRGIDVSVDVEVGLIAMHAFAHVIGKPTHGKNVAALIKRERGGGG